MMNYFPKDIQNIIYEYNNRQETFERIRNLIPNNTPEPFPNLKFKETRTLISGGSVIGDTKIIKRVTIIVPPYADEVLKSIRFNLESNIISVQLEIGGNFIDRIEQSTFKALRKLYQMEDNEIPFHLLKIGIPRLACHEIRFCVELQCNLKEELLLYADFYHCDQDLLTYQNIIPYFQVFNTNSYQIEPKTKLSLHWNFPIYYVIINSQNGKEMIINLDNAVKIYLIKIYQIDQYDVYALSKSKSYRDIIFDAIDFSFQNGEFCLEGNQIAHICPINSRELVICEGMVGFRRAN